jgi:hypothetical protein
MGLIAKESGGGGFTQVPEGVHRAVCYSVYDLGTHFDEKFSKRNRSVLFVWELPDERIDLEKDGQTKNLPRAISKKYTLSLNEKANLRKDLQSWRGRAFTSEELAGFDLQKVIGKPCQIQVIHKIIGEKTYANITAIMPLAKGQEAIAPENPVRFYSINDDRDYIPEGTPDWIADIIKGSDEWSSLVASGEEHHAEDDIPF